MRLELNANEFKIPYDKDHKVISLVRRHPCPRHTQFCQMWGNMKMSNNPAKYEALIKQYLCSVLEMSKLSTYTRVPPECACCTLCK